MTYISRKLATLVFSLNDWPVLRACPARAYWPALRAAITQLSANRPSDFYNIDACNCFNHPLNPSMSALSLRCL